MKKNLINNYFQTLLVVFASLTILSACNKELVTATPILYPKSGDTTIGGILNRDATLSFYKAAVIKLGLTNLLNDTTTNFTAFIPNNTAFINIGITSIAVINSLPATTLSPLINYTLIPGEQFVDTLTPVTTAFPNVQLPSYFTISGIPGTALPINMPLFPSKRPNGFWINNIPIIASNLRVKNGIIHIVRDIVAPPSQVLAQVLGFNPNLSLFNAAINRADSGQVPGTSSLNYVLAFPIANLTVFAPTNAAFAGIAITTAAQINAMPVQTVRALVVYHFLPSRAFSVNFPTTQTSFPTLLNSVVPTHQGLLIQSTLVGGYGAALQITGANNGGIAANSTAPTNLDQNAVNGVVHVIDRVLRPF